MSKTEVFAIPTSALLGSLAPGHHPLFSCIDHQGVQLLLDGVVDYLPNPLEVPNYALDTTKDEAKVRSNK